MPGLQAGSPVGDVREATNCCFSYALCFSPSLSPSFPLSLKINKILKKKKKKEEKLREEALPRSPGRGAFPGKGNSVYKSPVVSI